ncbi:hypothetical protein F5Y19DRAFT_484770 [Xylariaceae sp. FL1651]|nr:hypothetical protein F5Y19DRAFT_484770 [Xylariaceae sp. FL1651]
MNNYTTILGKRIRGYDSDDDELSDRTTSGRIQLLKKPRVEDSDSEPTKASHGLQFNDERPWAWEDVGSIQSTNDIIPRVKQHHSNNKYSSVKTSNHDDRQLHTSASGRKAQVSTKSKATTHLSSPGSDDDDCIILYSRPVQKHLAVKVAPKIQSEAQQDKIQQGKAQKKLRLSQSQRTPKGTKTQRRFTNKISRTNVVYAPANEDSSSEIEEPQDSLFNTLYRRSLHSSVASPKPTKDSSAPPVSSAFKTAVQNEQDRLSELYGPTDANDIAALELMCHRYKF